MARPPASDLNASLPQTGLAAQTPESDGMFLSAIVIGAVLVVAILTQAAPLLAAVVAGGALIPLWIHIKRKQQHADWLAETAFRPETPQEKRAAIAALIDALPQAIIVLGQGGIIAHANCKAENILGGCEEGRPLSTYLRHSGLRDRIEAAFEGQVPDTLNMQRIGSTDQHLHIQFSAAHNPTSTLAKDALVYAIISDVTQAKVEARQRADFLANASHELKTPLASLLGYIEALRGPAKDDANARETFLAIMQTQGERMERLIRDLLSLRRIELTEHIAPDQDADLAQALHAALEVVAPLAKRRGVEIETEISGDDADIRGHSDECVQLILNLVENAVKLSKKGARVLIRLEPLEGFSGDQLFGQPNDLSGSPVRHIVPMMPTKAPAWRLVILDHGPGFSRDHLPRIGERFYRVAGDLSSQEKGTGLGLAIVKHIAKRHRAGLFVRSAKNIGTEFSVVFPSAPD